MLKILRFSTPLAALVTFGLGITAAQAQPTGLYELCIDSGVSEATCLSLGFEPAAVPTLEEGDATPENDQDGTVSTVEVPATATAIITTEPSDNDTTTEIVIAERVSSQAAVNTAIESCERFGLDNEDCGIFYREVFAGACLEGDITGALCAGLGMSSEVEPLEIMLTQESTTTTTRITITDQDTDASATAVSQTASGTEDGSMMVEDNDTSKEASITVIEITGAEGEATVRLVEIPSEEQDAAHGTADQVDASEADDAEVQDQSPNQDQDLDQDHPSTPQTPAMSDLAAIAQECQANAVGAVSCYFDNEAMLKELCEAEGHGGLTACVFALDTAMGQ